jgi:hypothetical protein
MAARRSPSELPLEVLHHEEAGVVGQRAPVVDLYDVGVVDRRGRAGLLLEALHEVFFGAVLCAQHLHRHRTAARCAVFGAVHHAHAAVAQHTVDGVALEDGRAHEAVALGRDHEEVEHGAVDVADARVALQEPLVAHLGHCRIADHVPPPRPGVSPNG